MAQAPRGRRTTVEVPPEVYDQLRREAQALRTPVTRLVVDRLLNRKTVTEEVVAMQDRLHRLEALMGVAQK